MSRFLATAAAATLLLLSGAGRPVLAQGQVYDPAPPRGSAYVRIVNGVEGEVQARPDFLPQQRLGTAVTDRVMAYTVVENVANRQLRVEFQEGQRRGQASFRVEPGSFTTLLVHRGADGALAAAIITDTADFNRARAKIAFYNGLADCPAAALALLPSGPAIFDGVSALQTRARSVNPVNAQVQASCGPRQTAPIDLAGLEAGGMYSIWLIGGGGNVGAFLTRDTTARYRP